MRAILKHGETQGLISRFFTDSDACKDGLLNVEAAAQAAVNAMEAAAKASMAEKPEEGAAVQGGVDPTEELAKWADQVEGVICYMAGLPQRSFTTTMDDIEAEFQTKAVDGKLSVDQVCILFIKHYLPKVSKVVTATIDLVCSSAAQDDTRITPGFVCAMRAGMDTVRQWLLGGALQEFFILTVKLVDPSTHSDGNERGSMTLEELKSITDLLNIKVVGTSGEGAGGWAGNLLVSCMGVADSDNDGNLTVAECTGMVNKYAETVITLVAMINEGLGEFVCGTVRALVLALMDTYDAPLGLTMPVLHRAFLDSPIECPPRGKALGDALITRCVRVVGARVVLNVQSKSHCFIASPPLPSPLLAPHERRLQLGARWYRGERVRWC